MIAMPAEELIDPGCLDRLHCCRRGEQMLDDAGGTGPARELEAVPELGTGMSEPQNRLLIPDQRGHRTRQDLRGTVPATGPIFGRQPLERYQLAECGRRVAIL